MNLSQKALNQGESSPKHRVTRAMMPFGSCVEQFQIGLLRKYVTSGGVVYASGDMIDGALCIHLLQHLCVTCKYQQTRIGVTVLHIIKLTKFPVIFRFRSDSVKLRY